jgi:glycosyltransferase involved in cell wall biosynthesis
MKTVPVAVCIVVENLPVPMDRRVWQEALALSEAGYKVSVICPKGRGHERSRETLEGIEVYRHPNWEASGPFGYSLEYSWALAAEFFLAVRIYWRTRFRILHACNPPDTIFLIGRFFRIFGVHFIFDHHDLNPELFEAKFGKHGFFYHLICLAERLTFRTAEVSIATNESYRAIAIARGGMRPERVFIVRSVPELKRIRRGSPQIELKQGKKYLVAYLGVMGPQDGLDLLLESIEFIVKGSAKSQTSNPASGRDDVLFVLIGSGAELARLKGIAAQKGLAHVIKFTGRISDEELARYLSTADLCVAPDPATAMNDKSTMNKILEYMAFARPIVLYDLTEGRRSAGDAALYARPNDPVDFAGQILKLLDSECLRRELGERSRKRIEERLNWEMEKSALLSAYEAILSRW